MSDTPVNLETFEVWVEGEFAAHIQLVPEAEVLVAAMKSNPTIVWVQPE
jgi:hypothetical protein